MMLVTRGRWAVAAAALVLCTALVGCGSDGDDSAEASTTTAADGADVTTTTTDPEMFDQVLGELDGEIDAASGDLCSLMGVLDKAGAAGSPTSPDQAKAAATFIAKVYRAIADAAPDTVSAEAATVRRSADAIVAETRSADFDADAFIKNGPAAFSDADFVAAVRTLFGSIGDQCGGFGPPPANG